MAKMTKGFLEKRKRKLLKRLQPDFKIKSDRDWSDKDDSV